MLSYEAVDECRRRAANLTSAASNAEDKAEEVEQATGYATVYGLLVAANFALEQAAGVMKVIEKT